MTITSVPSIFYEFAFNADPNQNTLPPYWTDLSARAQYGWQLTRGRQYELDADETGTWRIELANTDGALDPANTASPYWPNVLPYRQCRIRVVLGNNLLAPDQASAGEYAGLNAGPAPAGCGVTSFGTAIATIASVGGAAYAGSRVWSTTVPSGTPGADVLNVSIQQVTAGQTCTASVQVQAATVGQSPAVYVAVNWIGANGQTVSTSFGSPSTLTGGSGTWTALSVTDVAPATAMAAQLRVVTSTTPSANSTIWTDALQWEARGYATRWQMPWTPGVNLLPQPVATGAESLNPATDSLTPYWYSGATGTTVTRATNLTAAPSGQSTAIAWSAPSGSTTSLALYAGSNAGTPTGPAADTVQVTAGLPYTASAYLTRTGPDATVTVTANIAWYGVDGTLLSTTTGSAATVTTSGWVRATATGTAPASAVWGRMLLKVATPSSFTGTETIYTTGWQMEQAASASVWADPGPPVFLFTGMVERWPESWDDLDGTYGTSKLECVDAFAALAQFPLGDPFINELLTYNPNFIYALADPAGSTTVVDTAARRIAAPVENSPRGPGSITFGSSVISTNPGGAFTGTSGTVATVVNDGSLISPPTGETYIPLHKTTLSPGPPASAAWTRILAFRTTQSTDINHRYTMWTAFRPGTRLCQFTLQNDPAGYASIEYANGAMYVITANGINDGNWHLAAIGVNPATGAGTVWCDGAVIGTATGLPAAGTSTADLIGCDGDPTTNNYYYGYIGDLAFATELPLMLTNAQMTSLYNSWRNASSGESTAARWSRILNWVGYAGATSVGAGSTSSMGPATDVPGQSALEALNAVAATENGESYANAAGALTFLGRAALYGVRTPAAIFGEGRPVGNAGEWPAEIGAIDFDPSHIANDVQITQYKSAVYTATDATSKRRYFPRRLQRTVNTTSGPEAFDAANYLLSQLKDPHQRAQAIRLHPSAIVGLFPVLARLDKNARIRYTKRPIGAPATTLDGFIQRIDWTCTPDSDFFVDYQVSPADLQNYWRMGALHTTLSAQANSGQKLVTINALPDAATNKLAQSLPSGYSLTFEPGTARAETVAIAAGGIPSTSLGYTTATLTMNVNLAFTHPAGSVVCEPLPTGYTDPTTWDAASVLGAAYAPILSGGAAGTNTVTIGPLPDAARNAVASNWNTGDVVWLSSGVPARAEAATIASVATTYPGYASCQITFTANLANNHLAGEYVSDPMPSNTITPATWTAPSTRAAY